MRRKAKKKTHVSEACRKAYKLCARRQSSPASCARIFTRSVREPKKSAKRPIKEEGAGSVADMAASPRCAEPRTPQGP